MPGSDNGGASVKSDEIVSDDGDQDNEVQLERKDPAATEGSEEKDDGAKILSDTTLPEAETDDNAHDAEERKFHEALVNLIQYTGCLDSNAINRLVSLADWMSDQA